MKYHEKLIEQDYRDALYKPVRTVGKMRKESFCINWDQYRDCPKLNSFADPGDIDAQSILRAINI